MSLETWYETNTPWQKGFIVATLVSTIAGTLTTSMNLHSTLQEKRKSQQQKQLDQEQSKHISNLQNAVERLNAQEEGQSNGNGSDDGGKSTKSSRNRRSKSISGKSQNGSYRNRGRRKSVGDDGSDSSEDFDRTAKRSRRMIEQQYEDNVRRLGPRYAQGDVIAENKLQAQVILLQQSVINVLQDAVINQRPLTKADEHRLIVAQQTARQGSLDALRDQYDRMLDQQQSRSIGYDPPRRQLTLPTQVDSSTDDSFPPPRRVKTLPALQSPPDDLLYCRYATDLQAEPKRNLVSSFAPTGSQRCPACDVRIPVSTQNIWDFETRTPVGDDSQYEVKSFTFDARLIVKSHTPSGELACYLCYSERDKDAFCPNVGALIKHLGSGFHTREEFEREVDMWVEKR